jgi:hypothetical protein
MLNPALLGLGQPGQTLRRAYAADVAEPAHGLGFAGRAQPRSRDDRT